MIRLFFVLVLLFLSSVSFSQNDKILDIILPGYSGVEYQISDYKEYDHVIFIPIDKDYKNYALNSAIQILQLNNDPHRKFGHERIKIFLTARELFPVEESENLPVTLLIDESFFAHFELNLKTLQSVVFVNPKTLTITARLDGDHLIEFYP